MTSASERRDAGRGGRVCRTCPALIAAIGASDQCRPCQQRSAAVRAAVGEPPPSHVAVIAEKPRSCADGGHLACPHFMAIYAYAKNLMTECDFCPICGAEGEEGEIVHKRGCALIVLVNAEPAS